MPTGVALRDVRRQLFDAAERVLLRDGPSALSSRAVTAEAGVAKGVLHKHFSDFDAFLEELVLDRIAAVEARAGQLCEAAGTGDLVGILADALTELFNSVASAIVALIISRDSLRTRLRRDRPTGIPLLTDAGHMLAGYLRAERDRGRIAPDADIETLAPMLIGGTHLLFADRTGEPPTDEAVRKAVASVIGEVLR